jgi:hypothetical protein
MPSAPDDPANLPVPVGPVVVHAPDEPKARAPGDPTFEAQLLGQPGAKRGLRGGLETLSTARSAYLGAEYSGLADRRPRPGLLKKTDI